MRLLTTFIDTGGVWHITYFWGMLLCVLLLMKRAPIPWQAKLLWLYCLGSALYSVEYPSLPFAMVNTAFVARAGQSLAELILIPLTAILAPTWVWKFVTPLVLVEIGLVCFTHDHMGLMRHPSFDNCLIALCLPYAPWWAALAGIATILSFHGSTALLILAVQVAVYAWQFEEVRGFKKFIASFLVVAGFFLYYHHGGALDGMHDRLIAYQHYMRLWTLETKHTIFGIGAGSFALCSMLLDNFRDPIFLDLHSDWLQITFEYGLVGVLLVGILMAKAVKTCKADPNLLAGVLSIGVFGLTYHPLRFFPTAFMVALILKKAISYKSKSSTAHPWR